MWVRPPLSLGPSPRPRHAWPHEPTIGFHLHCTGLWQDPVGDNGNGSPSLRLSGAAAQRPKAEHRNLRGPLSPQRTHDQGHPASLAHVSSQLPSCRSPGSSQGSTKLIAGLPLGPRGPAQSPLPAHVAAFVILSRPAVERPSPSPQTTVPLSLAHCLGQLFSKRAGQAGAPVRTGALLT